MKQEIFSEEEIERYSRQIALKEIGGAGQQKLKKSKVIVIGGGALGSIALSYLAAAGIGNLSIIDFDKVELSNLQRQILYNTQVLGQNKARVAAHNLALLNPNINIKAYEQKLETHNAEAILYDYDLVIDCTDNFTSHYLIADIVKKLSKTMISAAIQDFKGYVTIVPPLLDNQLGYRELFPEIPPQDALSNCNIMAPLGAIAGVIGSIQAIEAIKYILKLGDNLIGKLLVYDALEVRFFVINYNRN